MHASYKAYGTEQKRRQNSPKRYEVNSAKNMMPNKSVTGDARSVQLGWPEKSFGHVLRLERHPGMIRR